MATKPTTSPTLNTGNAIGALVTHAWLCHEGSGTTVHDLGASPVNGTFTSSPAPTWGTNSAGDPVVLGGSAGAYVNLASNLNFTLPCSFAWRAYQTTAAQQMPFGDTTGAALSRVVYNPPAGLILDIKTAGGSSDVAGFTGVTDFSSQTDNFVLTFSTPSGGNSTATLYKNGTSVGTATVAGTDSFDLNTFLEGYPSTANSLIGGFDYLYVFAGTTLTSTQAGSLNTSPYQVAQNGSTGATSYTLTPAPSPDTAGTPITVTIALTGGSTWTTGGTITVTPTGTASTGLSAQSATWAAAAGGSKTVSFTPTATGTLTLTGTHTGTLASGDPAAVNVTVNAPPAVAIGALSASANDPTGITVAATITPGVAPYTKSLYRSASAPFTPPGAGTLVATVTDSSTALSIKDTAPGSLDVYYRAIVTDSAGTPTTATSVQTASQVALFARRNLARYVFGGVGDSIMLGTGATSQATCALTVASNLVADAFPLRNVGAASNQGVTGTTSSDWANTANGANLATAITAMQAAGVTDCAVALGINDARIAVATATATYAANIAKVAASIAAAGIRVHLEAPSYPVPGTSGWDEAALGRIAAYRDALPGLVNGATVFLGATTALEYFARNAGQLSDGVHPNDAGHAALGAMWAQAFFASQVPTQLHKVRFRIGSN